MNKQVITQFLIKVFRKGSLKGATPDEAFFVKRDCTTMTQNDIDDRRVSLDFYFNSPLNRKCGGC